MRTRIIETPEESRTRMLETKKRHYLKHKTELLTKFNCPCGGSFDVFHIKQHFNTAKHRKFQLKHNLIQ